MKYRKKPVLVEAVQFAPGSYDNVCELFDLGMNSVKTEQLGIDGTPTLLIETLEGTMTAQPGDYIIKGVKGEFYPCKPDIFKATYELVDE